MNIFVLDSDPTRAAVQQCDKHVCKMSIEYAQLLSAAHHLWSCATSEMYKLTHKNHPATKWVAAHPAHYAWTYALACATWDEYRYRYGRDHASSRLREVLKHPPATMQTYVEPTPPPQCMPDTCRVDGQSWNAVVEAYHIYYREAKASFATWKNREVPSWFSPVV